MRDKTGDRTEAALRHFTGGFRIKLCYSDNSPEIADACRRLGIPHEQSHPGVPQNNGIIERANGDILAMTRTALVQAGLPNHCWAFAAPCVVHNDNCTMRDGVSSPWYKAHNKGEFPEPLYPFGCSVWFLPSDTKSKRGRAQSLVRPKWGGRAEPGIFAGYVMAPTGLWTGRYYVWSLSAFDGLDLSATASGKDKRAMALRSPHETMRVSMHGMDYMFPARPSTTG